MSAGEVEARDRQRQRRIKLSVLAAGLERGMLVLGTAISVPLLTGYYGKERFGLLMTITSLTGFLGFADLGIGNGLINAISEAYGKDDRKSAKRYVTGSIFLLSSFAVLFGLIFMLLFPGTDWAKMLNAQSPPAAIDAGPAVLVFAWCFAINIPLGIVQRIRIGYQEGYVNSLWMVAANALSLLGLFLVVLRGAGLGWAVGAIMSASILAGIFNGISLFGYSRPWLRPDKESLDVEAGLLIFRAGLAFLLLQLGTAATFATDNLVIARKLGNAAVAEYSVCARMFSVLPMVQNLLLAPLWPAYREAIVRGESGWVRRWLKKSMTVATLVSFIPSIILIFAGDKIVYYWTGKLIMPSRGLLIALGMATISLCFVYALGTFLNAANLVFFQAVIVALLAAFGITGKIAIAGIWGLPGIGIVSCIAFIAIYIVPSLVFIGYFMRKRLPVRSDAVPILPVT